jgi:PadR family transcriptional regulator, regulatory protein PadR
MDPIERFKKTNTEGNLWVYIISLAKNREVVSESLPGLIFEKFGFLPGTFLTSMVLMRLKRQGMVSAERTGGKKSYKATQKGLDELQKMREFCQMLMDKI